MSDQPALLMPIMTILNSALDDERELEQADKKRRDELVQRSKAENGPVSLLHGPHAANAGYEPMKVPGK